MKEYQQILSELKQGKYAPVYFLQGEETFYIDAIIKQIEHHALDESQRSFNQLVFYGKDTDLATIIGAARRYPMMGERQVVIVKEAQEIREWTKEDKQILVLGYLQNPLASTVLVFGYKHKTLDKRTKLGKAFEQHATLLSAKKMYDDKIPAWIRSLCGDSKVKIEEGATMMLSEHIGNNLHRIANEIEKLLLNLKEGDMITRQMVEKYVGINKDYNVFELQKALGARQKKKVIQIAKYFGANPGNNPLVLIITNLFNYFSKLLMIHQSSDKSERSIAALIGVNPYFVREYLVATRNYPLFKVMQNIKFLHEADLQSKGIGFATKKEGEVLEELVFKLMN